MTIEFQNKPEEEEKTNIVPFTAIGGGGDGDWLTQLPVGCRFLVIGEDKNGIGLVEYWIHEKGKRGVRILRVGLEGEQSYWVNPPGFCKQYNLYEILES